jgi:glycosyltransferase involved in cell wall biosynthesis
MSRPRVLVLAEMANPEWVSVPLVGWSHARALMDVCDAHLVTQIRNRAAILRAGLIEGRDFTAIDSEAVAARGHKLAKFIRRGKGMNWTTQTAIEAIGYIFYEHLTWKKFGARIRAKEFDVVHRITMLSPIVPSPIARHCAAAGVPFVLGPLNGGVPWPRGFDAHRRREREWLSYVREAYKLLPGYRSTRQNAAVILVGSRFTYEQIPQTYRHKVFYMPENAIDESKFTKRRTRTASLPLRAIFVGRLVPLKGMDMLLEAAAGIVRERKLTIEIVGAGPEEARLKEFVLREGFGEEVTFTGWLKHEQVIEHIAEADLLLLPSIREFGGGAALEAMAVGVPPLVLNYGGPAELVTPASGFLVEMGSRARIVRLLRETLSEIVADPSLIDQKAKVAYRRAHEQFTWPAKVRQTLAVYDWALGRAKERPHFPMPMPDPPM